MLEGLNKKASKLSYVDIKLVELTLLILGLILAKLFPRLLNISFPVLITMVSIAAIKPFYTFWIKK